MTEAEWLANTNPESMLASLRCDLSTRKLRLFSCACCRRVWHLLSDLRSRAAVEVAERAADGLVDGLQLAGAEADAELAFQSIQWEPNGMPSVDKLALSAAWAAVTTNLEETVWGGRPVTGFAINTALQAGDAADDPNAERTVQAELLRDICGNPFRRVVFESVWRTPTTLTLAASIYEDRAFDRMPILADAMEEAGCDCTDILIHCRAPCTHVRGCWVIDLVLGKE